MACDTDGNAKSFGALQAGVHYSIENRRAYRDVNVISKCLDLTPYTAASDRGQVLKKGDIIIYGSTVYSGATGEDCVPALRRVSEMTYKIDFFAATATNASIPATRCTDRPRSARSPRVPLAGSRTRSTHFMPAE